MNNGMVGLKSLNKNIGSVEMTTTDAADNLGDELEGFFFGGVIGEGKTGVGLNDAYGGELGKIEAFGDGLGADDDINLARFDVVIEGAHSIGFGSVGVETGDFCIFKKFFEFGFEEFGAETFVEDVGGATMWAGFGSFLFEATGVAD